MIPAYVRKAIAEWTAWRAHRRLYAVIPEFRDLDRREADNARQHRPVGPVLAEKRRVMAERLSLECGRHA